MGLIDVIGDFLGIESDSERAAGRLAEEQSADLRRRSARTDELLERQIDVEDRFRGPLFDELFDITTTTDPNVLAQHPSYALLRQPLESQFSRAEQQIRESTPPGGALGRHLSELYSTRAGTIGRLPSEIREKYYPAALGLATGDPQGTASLLQTGGQLGQSLQAYYNNLFNQGAAASRNLFSELGQVGTQIYNYISGGGDEPSVGGAEPEGQDFTFFS